MRCFNGLVCFSVEDIKRSCDAVSVLLLRVFRVWDCGSTLLLDLTE